MNNSEFFSFRLPLYRKNPPLFFQEVLDFYSDSWQKEAGLDIAGAPRISIRSGQGVGKTGFEAASILWFLSCFPYARVVATAPTRQQLNDVLWSEVAKWQERSPLLRCILRWTKTYIYMAGYEKRWFAVARTATKPENMQGFHADNMLIVVDEASGVSDPIMEAILGTLTGKNNKLLLCGNPTRATGVFYDSYTRNRSLYKTHRVNALDSPRTSKENIQALLDKYGKDSNIARVRVYGEPPLQDDDVFISITLVEKSIQREYQEGTKPSITQLDLGCDVARFGDDETVIAVKVSTDELDEILPLEIRRGQDTMRTTGDLIRLYHRMVEAYPDYQGPIFIKVDDTGVGGGVTDRLREVQKEMNLDRLVIIPVLFAGSVKTSKDYADIATVMWGHAREMMKHEELKLPNDAELVAQFSVRKYDLNSRGKIQLESKKDMKKRGIKSPDRADAVVMACIPVKLNQNIRERGDNACRI